MPAGRAIYRLLPLFSTSWRTGCVNGRLAFPAAPSRVCLPFYTRWSAITHARTRFVLALCTRGSVLPVALPRCQQPAYYRRHVLPCLLARTPAPPFAMPPRICSALLRALPSGYTSHCCSRALLRLPFLTLHAPAGSGLTLPFSSVPFLALYRLVSPAECSAHCHLLRAKYLPLRAARTATARRRYLRYHRAATLAPLRRAAAACGRLPPPGVRATGGFFEAATLQHCARVCGGCVLTALRAAYWITWLRRAGARRPRGHCVRCFSAWRSALVTPHAGPAARSMAAAAIRSAFLPLYIHFFAAAFLIRHMCRLFFSRAACCRVTVSLCDGHVTAV